MDYIVFGNRTEKIGCRVILWNEPGGLSFNSGYIRRNSSEEQIKKDTKQFTIHWSDTYKAKETHSVLVYRKLSSNFIIDDDNVDGCATIYQTLDMRHAGQSQGPGLNVLGPGVEVSYHPDRWLNDKRYSKENIEKFKVQEHKSKLARVHGSNLNVYLPSEAQMVAIRNLVSGFLAIFPDVPAKFPRDSKGNFLYTKVTDPLKYSGLALHYHLRNEKIDVAGFDMERLETDLAKEHPYN